jgi:sensor domain CHASE-containing protein
MNQPADQLRNDKPSTSMVPAPKATLWQRAGVRRRVPTSAWVIFALFLCAALVMAIHAAVAGHDANLRLKVQHNLRSADLSVWVNDDLVYSGKLVGIVRKKFGLIPDIQGNMSETLPISSGTKQVRVRVVSDDGSEQENTISGDFVRNAQQTLSVVARRGDLSLSWQHPETAVPETASSVQTPPNPGWVDRYAGSLLMTVAGSIISALTGYAIKELPKIASR